MNTPHALERGNVDLYLKVTIIGRSDVHNLSVHSYTMRMRMAYACACAWQCQGHVHGEAMSMCMVWP